jgi:isoquinoline 1-oxidoreductase beta subunit
MTAMKSPARRKFLKSSAVLGGGLVIAFYLPAGSRRAFAQDAAKPVYPPNAFLRIGKDNSVTVMVKHLEFGQGVLTSLPMILAEELECDWSKIKSELAPAALVYANTFWGVQGTGGSSSVANSWDQLRTIGAQARTMLIEAAATQWKVKPDECRAVQGFVLGPSGKKASYGQLADAAARLPVPGKVALKDPKLFKIIGKPTRRIDAAGKINGKAIFGMDMKLPNLHTAVVAHAPVFGAKVVSVNADKIKSIPGITHVVQLSGAVAVVAKNFWLAKQGRDALDIEWDLGQHAALSTAVLRDEYRVLAGTPGMPARQAENPDAIKGAAKTLVAEYDVPFLAHAPMEPLNCTLHYKGDSCEVWVGSQFQTADQAAVARVLGLKPEQVKLNTLLAGGGFGRRANPVSDYIVEAARIAQEVKAPVKVVWTREDDIKGGYYRPMYVHRVVAGLDARGNVAAWNHTIVGQSILAGTPFEQMMVKGGIDATSVEGVADTPYDIPNLSVTLHS